MVIEVNFEGQTVEIRYIGTHDQYDTLPTGRCYIPVCQAGVSYAFYSD